MNSPEEGDVAHCSSCHVPSSSWTHGTSKMKGCGNPLGLSTDNGETEAEMGGSPQPPHFQDVPETTRLQSPKGNPQPADGEQMPLVGLTRTFPLAAPPQRTIQGEGCDSGSVLPGEPLRRVTVLVDPDILSCWQQGRGSQREDSSEWQNSRTSKAFFLFQPTVLEAGTRVTHSWRRRTCV